MQPDEIESRLEDVLAQIAAAAIAAGRNPNEVRLVAVSKTHPPESIRQAVDAGQSIFGESRLQEALAKIPLLPNGLHWHFIGHLQKNKIRKALPHFELFHGVDSPDLADEIDRIALDTGHRTRVLIEVNVACESSKFGFQPDALPSQFERLLGLRAVDVEGLMAIPPPAEKPGESRRYFAILRELRDRLAAEFGVPLSTLSMGMSDDFAEAIAEGSTMVRIGTAIFGARPRPDES